jgi:signal transduction histidine kinase
MLAVTIDLVLVLAAWSTVMVVWLARRRFQPSSVWEKLMVGSTLLAFALMLRFADTLWVRIPWPAISSPLIQQIAVVIGLMGGTLAVVAGVVEWVPGFVALGVRARWREAWAQAQQRLVAELEETEQAERVSTALVELVGGLCGDAQVSYHPYRQSTREFISRDLGTDLSRADWQQATDRVTAYRQPVVMRTSTGWLMIIPVALEQRIYGAVTVIQTTEHISLSETPLLHQSAQRAALAIHGIVRRSRSLRRTRVATVGAELERQLGSDDDPTADLLNMLNVLHRELGVDFVACLAYEGDGAYARRFSRLWGKQALTEQGIQVAIGHAALPQVTTSERAMVMQDGHPVLSPAAVPHADMLHRLAVPLYRGRRSIGLLVVASRCKALRLSAHDMLRRWGPSFATALERIRFQNAATQLSRRLTALGKLAARPLDSLEGQDYLTARMLDEVPGTFCQYMRVDPDNQSLHVAYRRARRAGFGRETAGQTLGLADLPTCRMVIENGRSVLFRQDDPERNFDSQEAEELFGVVPSSLLLVPVVREGSCQALLAVGELREPKRHTYSAEDRRFADSLARLHTARSRSVNVRTAEPLNGLGDLNLTFASPLTGIMGSVEILRQQTRSADPENKYLDVIERNAARIRDTVSQLAELSHHGPTAVTG